MSLLATLDGFFSTRAALAKGERMLVAFSGGPDSTALLSALARWRRDRKFELLAAHLDHGMDPGSAARADAAARLAAQIGVPVHRERWPVPALRRRGESAEAAARRVRYRFLERTRRSLGARWVATGHHADDQAETLLLRLEQGTGLAGLAGIAPRRESIVRPLLDLSRSDLARWLDETGLEPVLDPTNRDLEGARNRIRHRLAPSLDPDALSTLVRLATTARRAERALLRRVEAHLEPGSVGSGISLSLSRRRLLALPTELRPVALRQLHRTVGAAHPPSAAAQRELDRQLDHAGRIGVDCGAGWWLGGSADVLRLARGRSSMAPFAYTLALPGEVELPDGCGNLRLRRAAPRSRNPQHSNRRATLSLPAAAGERITVRSRRPGDRIQPLGCSYDRRLKDVLIDRKVPRNERDRLPLLCFDRRIVWIPGVTIDERSRVTDNRCTWVAEWNR